MANSKQRDMPDLSKWAVAGAEIAVRVTPKAARNAVILREDELRVSVTVAPENGKANEAVQQLLAQAMQVPPSSLTLRRGHSGRDKVFCYDVEGVRRNR